LTIAVIAAAAGFYYYFKTIRAMWWIESGDSSTIPLPAISKISIAALTALTLVFGVYPDPILALLK
jgi:NADH-quinone oxidoreductase subunit N